MFRSKPIGWITAGTLFCVAGVALACRLRDGKETTAEANAAVCPAAGTEAKDENPAPAKTTAEPKEPEKKEKESPLPPAAPSPDKPPMIGEMVAPAASLASEEKKTDAALAGTAPAAVPPPSTVAPPPPAPAAEATTAPVPEVAKVPEAVPVPAPPKANLLSPEMTAEAAPIRPVSGSEGVVSTPPPSPPSTEKTPAWSAVPVSEKKEEPKADPKTPETPKETSPTPLSAASVPASPPLMKEQVTGPAPSPAPATPIVAPVSPAATEPPAAPPSTPPVTSSPPPPSSPPTDRAAVPPTAPSTSLYKVRGKGETLRAIASRTLGSGERWQEIYRLNPDLHPELIVPSGKAVHLPADAKLDTAPEGCQSESEHTGPPPSVTTVRPLPVVRPRQPGASEKHLAPLTGTYLCQLNNRSLVLPKDAADQLGKVETMLLTPGPDRCLWIGTQASVARVLERVEKSSAADREVQTFRRIYFAQTEKASVSDAGKMMIPEKLAEYAGLGKEVVLVGIDDHFELWDAARWQHYSQQKEPSLKP